MLQRIYGTAWFKKEDQDAYLHQLEEARKRDHRKLGKELDLFMFHPFAPGAVFWTDRGTTIVNVLNDYLRELQRDDYKEIKTPLLYNKGLWEISGHWGKYRENMFLVLDKETGEHDFSLKPMNCPSHYLLYQSKKHSYRELPLRYCTYDVLHRNEVSGALSGLTRVRQFQQDDCHVFLTEQQIAGGGSPAHRFHPELLQDLRAHRDAQVRHSAQGADRRGLAVGSRRGGAPGRPRGDRAGLRAQAGRRRLLRPQGRLSTSPTRSAGPGSWERSSSTTPLPSASG